MGTRNVDDPLSNIVYTAIWSSLCGHVPHNTLGLCGAILTNLSA